MSVVDVAGTWWAADAVRASRAGETDERAPRWALGRRGLQLALGVLWVLDGALQLQAGMLTARFAHQVVAPAATGQPGWVAWIVLHGARAIAGHAAVSDLAFALIQLALGIGLLVPRTVRPALAASVGWATGVWVVGEGLGGIAGGTASFLTGAPGAAALYGLLALAAWPGGTTATRTHESRAAMTPPAWFPRAWAVLWVGLGALALFPANRSPSRVAMQLAGSAGSSPAWLGDLDRVAAEVARRSGVAGVVLLGLGPVAVGLFGLGHGRARRTAARTGIALAAVTWVVGQNFGQLYSGIATDPNSAPLLVVAGLALLGTQGARHACCVPTGQASTGCVRGAVDRAHVAEEIP